MPVYVYTQAMHAVVRTPLGIDALVSAVEQHARARGEGCGAVAVFTGVVRATHLGRRVTTLEYEGFEPLAIRVFERIDAEITSRWPHAVVAIHHRIGRLQVGDLSVVIAAATAHRADAFQVTRYAIERIKQVAPIWKREHFEDGAPVWVEGAVTEIDDAHARQAALDTACA